MDIPDSEAHLMADTANAQCGTSHQKSACDSADRAFGARTPTREPKASTMELLYSINDTPPWYLIVFLGLQHYLTAFGAMLSIPLILGPVLCIQQGDVALAELLSTMFFISGLITVLQSTFGTRLPIVQGGSFSFLAPTFAILSLPQFKCPLVIDTSNITSQEVLDTIRSDEVETWQIRMREIQGGIMLSSLFQIVIGSCGVMGMLLNYIGPLAIAPTIALVGFALFQPAANYCAGHWWIALTTIVVIVALSQYLRNVDIPCAALSRGPNKKLQCSRVPFPLFRLFPIILGICVSWLICYCLTVTDTLPTDPDQWGYKARTDTKIEVLSKAAWFRFPYPLQWGLPTVSVASVFGMLAGTLSGMIESVGDYYACAKLSGAPPPPVHAINRGILVEGLGCLLAGMWGSGSGTTSYSENIGTIGITKVGSRVVVQTSGLIMIVFGMFSKFGAFFATIPEPIVGGVFMVSFGIIAAVGISNLQYVDLNSSRNLFIIGFSFFFGLSLPQWMASNPGAIQTGSDIFDQILTVLLSTSMFVGGAVGFFLDNTVPGTPEERGILKWRQQFAASYVGGDSSRDTEASGVAHRTAMEACYDLPWCMGCVRRLPCFTSLPFCPPFKFCCRRCTKIAGDDHMADMTIEVTTVDGRDAPITGSPGGDYKIEEKNGTDPQYNGRQNVTHRTPGQDRANAEYTYL